MSTAFTPGELTSFKRGGWRGLAQGAAMSQTTPLTVERATEVLRAVEVFARLERKNTDEVGWLALRFSISIARATRLRDQARAQLLTAWPRALLPRLVGAEAIRYAEAHGLLLSKYADPAEGVRWDCTVAEAHAIAREDPNLVYLDPREQLGAR